MAKIFAIFTFEKSFSLLNPHSFIYHDSMYRPSLEENGKDKCASTKNLFPFFLESTYRGEQRRMRCDIVAITSTDI